MGNVVRLTFGNRQHEITIKEFQRQRVVTFQEIDELHQRPEGTARKRFHDNRERFIKDTDFFEVSPKNGHTLTDYGFSEFAPTGTLITESGYLMLVKSFTDNLAWQVQRQLVNSYFRGKRLGGSLGDLSPQLQVLINLELKQKQLEQRIDDIQDAMLPINDDWRKDAVKKLRKIGFRTGKYKDVTQESYELLEQRAGCDLDTRLDNIRKRMALEGASKTAIDNTNYLDVIEQDKRLKEIYIAIVNQMYIKYVA